jgi:glutamate racemase
MHSVDSTTSQITSIKASSAIGVFDSGVGGISVLKHIRAAMPSEHLLYVADSKFAPYGSRTPEFIRERADAIAQFLMERGAKALVVACNTATAAAAEYLRGRYSIPIIAMEPAVKPAAQATKTGVIGVLATSGTLKSAQFAALLEHYGQQVQVVTQACHGLVECIERGDLTGVETEELLSRYVKPLLDAHADTIVLGCTHYPFLRPLIEKLVGPDVAIVDTGAAVARHLKHRLEALQLVAPEGAEGSVEFWSNSLDAKAKQVIGQLWGESVILKAFEC